MKFIVIQCKLKWEEMVFMVEKKQQKQHSAWKVANEINNKTKELVMSQQKMRGKNSEELKLQ